MAKLLRLATLTSVLVLLTAGAATAAAAPPPPAPVVAPPIKALDAATPAGSPFEGDGMWIWYARLSSGGTPDAIAERAARSGIETVFIKSADGANHWSQFNASYVAALKARGLRVCAWQYVYGRRPVLEARAARRALDAGAECFVIDAEIEYEGKYAQASAYMAKLRAYAGDSFPIGLAGWPYVDYHPAYPFSVFLGPGGAQFSLPQMYWRAIGTSVDEVYEHTYLWNSLYGRPIAPLGQLYQRPTRAEITRFRQLAVAYSAPGLSWWSWQSASSGGWAALARVFEPLSVVAVPGPVAPTLARGARGDVVVWAQQHLLAAGQTVRVTGRFDAATKRAVRAFQEAVGLPVTYKLDPATWQSLLAREPVAVRWRAGNRAVPASAKLRPRMKEIPPKPR